MRKVISVLALIAMLGFRAAGQQQPPIPPPEDVAKPPADAIKSASGLASKVVTPGTGKTKPAATDIVTVQYTGWHTDGKTFDSTAWRKDTPATFPLDRVIKGWGEGVQLMVVGEKRRLWIPSELAYNNTPGRPAGMLVFDIELLEFNPSPRVPPPDVAAPPSDAKRTSSGLAYKSLRAGKGGQRPEKTSTVTVHYTGWTTDGKMFDSSVARGMPAKFPLAGVIPGWTEGVQLMVVGEKTRFWIPGGLAYDNSPNPGAPKGMLVFDIELLGIQNPTPPTAP